MGPDARTASLLVAAAAAALALAAGGKRMYEGLTDEELAQLAPVLPAVLAAAAHGGHGGPLPTPPPGDAAGLTGTLLPPDHIPDAEYARRKAEFVRAGGFKTRAPSPAFG